VAQMREMGAHNYTHLSHLDHHVPHARATPSAELACDSVGRFPGEAQLRRRIAFCLAGRREGMLGAQHDRLRLSSGYVSNEKPDFIGNRR